MGLSTRAACIISGGLASGECLYVGDDHRDVQAAHAAGMGCLVAGYGYLGDGAPPEEWGGLAIISHPAQVREFV